MNKYNYHTHTYRCGHAKGKEIEMIESAISIGVKDLGFSEHIPLPHYKWHLIKGIFQIKSIKSFKIMLTAFKKNGPNMRLNYHHMEEHLNLLKQYKEQYKDKINIYTGFEAEGFKNYFPYYQSLLDNHHVDYLILGHHFHKCSIDDDYIGRKGCTKKDIYTYCEDIEEALSTQLFTYLAHPDLFLLGYDTFDEDARIVSERICKAAKKYNVPLEVNGGGIRRGMIEFDGTHTYSYPNKYFWEVASQYGNDVVIGIDAHHPRNINDEIYCQLYEFVKVYNLKLIDQLQFKKGNKNF